jgi:hypothetical protein
VAQVTSDPAPEPGDARAVSSPFDHDDVEQALVEVDRAEARVLEAQHEVEVRRAALTDTLFRLGQPYRDGTQQLTQPQAAAIYWDRPELKKRDAARAVGLSTTRLQRLAGPRRTDRPCSTCGHPTEVLLTSTSSSQHVVCDPCEQAARESERLERELELERLRARNGAIDVTDPWHDDLPAFRAW